MEWHFAPTNRPERVTECYVKLLPYPIFKVGEELHVSNDGTLINDIVTYFPKDANALDGEGFYKYIPYVDNKGQILWHYIRIDDELVVHWAEAYISKITKLGAEQLYENFHS